MKRLQLAFILVCNLTLVSCATSEQNQDLEASTLDQELSHKDNDVACSCSCSVEKTKVGQETSQKEKDGACSCSCSIGNK